MNSTGVLMKDIFQADCIQLPYRHMHRDQLRWPIKWQIIQDSVSFFQCIVCHVYNPINAAHKCIFLYGMSTTEMQKKKLQSCTYEYMDEHVCVCVFRQQPDLFNLEHTAHSSAKRCECYFCLLFFFSFSLFCTHIHTQTHVRSRAK